MFNTMCFLEKDGIVYQDPGKIFKVKFKELDYGWDNPDGTSISFVVEELAKSKVSAPNKLYHLAAIVQKVCPEVNWDWNLTFKTIEETFFGSSAYFKAYLRSMGMSSIPIYYYDYQYDDLYRAAYFWAVEQGLYRTPEEIEATTKKNVQELIYDRAKTDFVDLTLYHEFMNKQNHY